MRRIELEVWQQWERATDLGGVVARIADNDLQWSILRYDGVCEPPGGRDHVEFRTYLDGHASGYLLGFAELRAMAQTCRWTRACFVVAATSISALTAARLNRDFSQCAVVILRAGHGRWQLWLDTDARLTIQARASGGAWDAAPGSAESVAPACFSD